MTETLNREEADKALFMNLIMMLASSAMQQLGKLVNPLTNKTEINMEGAKITIDMLEMLKNKTKGNLDQNEEKMFKDMLSSLQINYVDTVNSQPQQKPEEHNHAEPEVTSDIKEKKEEQKPEPSNNADSEIEQKETKFHKSYGE